MMKGFNLIPGGSQTYSKAPRTFPENYPRYLTDGYAGIFVTDEKGRMYKDYILGLGAVLLGYGNTMVNKAVRDQLDKGISFSLPHPLEGEVASLLSEMIPCAEGVRFFKTGSEGCEAAVRAARAYTGRKGVACWGFHGWLGWYASTTLMSAGTSQNDTVKAFKSPKHLREYLHLPSWGVPPACVIMEPLQYEEEEAEVMKEIRKVCRELEIVFILDETITGFRLARGGAQEAFQVKADLSVQGKGIANGMPLSSVTGIKDIMKLFDGTVFCSGTFGGETLSLAAAKATLEQVSKEAIREALENGAVLQNNFNDHNTAGLEMVGLPHRMFIKGFKNNKVKTTFYEALVEKGVLVHPGVIYHALGDFYGDGDEEEDKPFLESAEEMMVNRGPKGRVINPIRL